MEFALGVLLLWLGVAGLYVAFHGTDSTTPWAIYKEVLGQGGSTADTSAASSGGTGADTSTPAPTGGQ